MRANLDVDNAERLQRPECIAHRHTADAELLGKLDFGAETVAGRQLAAK